MNVFKRRTAMSLVAVLCLSLLTGLLGYAQAQQNTPGSNEIEVLQLRPNFYMIAGAGGNIAVQVGEDGVVLVDTGSVAASEPVLAEIKKLTGQPIRYIINTSADADHVGGNEKISKAGKSLFPPTPGGGGVGVILSEAITNSGGAAIFAHDNVLARMSAPEDQKKPAYPTYALPSATYTDKEKDTYLNGEGIQVLYQPAAHTDGDSMVFFRRSDVLVTGDIFSTDTFPVIDLAKGGSIRGEIDALNRIIGITIPQLPLIWQEGGTLVIPGHGRICDEADVVEYRDMVIIIRDVIQDLIQKGETLEQIKAADPTKEYRGRYGADSGSWTTDMFVEAVYRSLVRKDQSVIRSHSK